MNTKAYTLKVKNRILSFLSILAVSSSFLIFATESNAVDRKKPNWLASCPEVMDSSPELPTPKTILLGSPSGTVFKLLAKDSTDYVTIPQSIIGCYVIEELVTDKNQSPEWQIGSLSRDSNGFYFKNAANAMWRLSLNTESFILEIEPGSTYYKAGAGFQLDYVPQKASDCKVKDYIKGAGRLGFPRNADRVPALGLTKNLILVVDFPDAVFTQNMSSAVENVLGPKIVENFYYSSSNGKLRPTFTIFPTVIRLKSLEKSFAPNASGGFFVDGVQQDFRLVQEALDVAKTQGNLDGYSSINVFAPTAYSMEYYGSAFISKGFDIGGKLIYNTQLVGGGIGTINSPVPSWKVFAHEYGHLLGMYDYYLQGTSNSGKSPGPFDLMGNTTGSANSFLGFQRWVQGWLEDSDVDCDFEPNSSVLHKLSPLNDISGKRLYVHPLDGTTALAVEFRTEGDIDRLNGNDGLLVYLTDMKIAGLRGPISIKASEQDLVINPPTDRERYATAPLSTGQFVRVKDLVIFAETVGVDKASFRVFTKSEFEFKQEADAKAAAEKAAAAELKAKQEADAKAAAELKAKQEADAKAAAELKAKQEAEAKAAAELKAAGEKIISDAKAEATRILAAAKAAAAKKKITITCVKGKLTKKVTALKPVCPKGYRKKA